MKRSFLTDLGIEDEIIDKIMAEHGKTTQKLLDKISAKDAELQQAQGELNDNIKELEKFKKIDIEKLKSDAEEWKAKYENFEKDSAVDEFFRNYEFTSDLAKKATVQEFKNQNFKFKDGKFDGAEEFMKKFVEENKSAFAQSEPSAKPETTQNSAGAYSYKPAGNNPAQADAFATALDDIFKD